MPRRHYDWSGGPAIIEQHSLAKHDVLRAYLALLHYPWVLAEPGRIAAHLS